VQETIKTSGAPYLRVSDSIDIQRKGGVIRLQSGKRLTRAVLADSLPQIGGRYLLFLKYNQETEDYGILMGYQFAGSDVYRLDDLNFRDSTHEQAVHALFEEGMSADQFLSRAKSTFVSEKS